MSYFEQIYKRIFGKPEAKHKPVHVDELLKRSTAFDDRFQLWKTSDDFKNFMRDLRQSYISSKQGMEQDATMLVMQSPYSNGIAIDHEGKYSKTTYQFLLDYLAEQVKKLGYVRAMSRRTLREREGMVETIEMHHLKPKRGFVEPIDQKYGNVLIEYVEENNEPRRIKFLVNSYPDRKYTQALNFDDLAQHIFTVEN